MKALAIALITLAGLLSSQNALADSVANAAIDANLNLAAAKAKHDEAKVSVKNLTNRMDAVRDAKGTLATLDTEQDPALQKTAIQKFFRQWKTAEGTGTFDLTTEDGRTLAKEELATLEDDLTKKLETAQDDEKKAGEAQQAARTAYEKAKAAQNVATKPAKTLPQRLRGETNFRCKMALCWGGKNGQQYAVEPVLDLPFSLTWSVGDGALPGYINSHVVNLEFNAGLRFWFAYDILSIAVFVSEPIIKSSDPIRVEGSDFSHGVGAIHRSYPSVGLGFFGDALLLGISYDVLRNGPADENQDPNFPPNEVLSRSLTFSLGFSFLNLARNQVGRSDAK